MVRRIAEDPAVERALFEQVPVLEVGAAAFRSPSASGPIRAFLDDGLIALMDASDLTLLVAFVAGVLSFLSPCVLPLVPAYIGQLTVVAVVGRAQTRSRRAGWRSATPSPTSWASGPSSRSWASPRPSSAAPSPTTCRPCARSAGSS